ncbi:MAG TPA: kynureninase [Deinococcales bacterium]|nr:kynureninase [Deinococcales bacterium]
MTSSARPGTPPLSSAAARQRDENHPLAAFRERFFLPDPELVYLDGNSLGRLPQATRTLLRDLVDRQWGEQLIRSWNEGWFEAAERLGNKLSPLLGAAPGQTIFANSTSVNLYKLVLAALQRQAPRRTIVSDSLNFPSDLYIMQGAADLHGAELRTVPPAGDGRFPDEDAIAAAVDDGTALLVLTHVAFKSGWQYDMRRLTEAAHAHGALVLWDLSHSVGAVPLELDACGVDLAVGCSYKYVNGGPGAPAFLYVSEKLRDELRSPIQGWFGQADPFAFGLDYEPAPGVRRFTAGTPPLLSLLAVEPGLDLLLEAGMDRIRDVSVQLTSYLLELAEARLGPLGFTIGTPHDPARRGSHVSVHHPDGYRIAQALIRAGIIPDFRAPDGIRLGIAPLYTGFLDVWRAVDAMVDISGSGAHLELPQQTGGVT